MSIRYFDGETAEVHPVAVRVTTNELVIYRSAGAEVVARWPIGDVAVLGDVQHEVAPPVVRRGSDARLIIEDPQVRSDLASLVPALRPLVPQPVAVGRRIAVFSSAIVALVGLFWGVLDYGTEYAAPLLPHSLQARAGQFLTRFGRLNPTHPHTWDLVDQPFALGRVFGSEGNRGAGVELSWLTPLSWYGAATSRLKLGTAVCTFDELAAALAEQ